VLGSIELLCYPLFRWLEDGQRSLSTKQPLPATIAIVCATVASGASLAAALPTWQANKPTEIWIVTNALAYSSNEKCLADFLSDKVRLVQCSQTNKRAQLCEGFKRTTSEFIVICDDDTVWTPNVLKKLIQPLQRDARVGAVFPEVKFRPGARVFTLWETMSALRLSGDAIDIRTSMLFDGGVFCASGTTAAYRGKVLRDTVFLRSFPNELWMKKQLNAGDDQSLTLWLANHDWNCRVVADDGLSGCSVLTSPRTDWKHLSQLMRWSRSDWQACLNATMASDAIWRSVRLHHTAQLMLIYEENIPIQLGVASLGVQGASVSSLRLFTCTHSRGKSQSCSLCERQY
jgi:cellulose synthase/poly-beta-1,6-N-acetylglucosamine synthase-like glycosyltransferase